MATTIELTERRGKARAASYYVFAAIILFLLLGSCGPNAADIFRGMWLA